MEVQVKKAQLRQQKELLSKRKLEVEQQKKGIDSVIRKEKSKRYKLEMNVKENLERHGFVALESGGVIATPSHAKVELQVREEQLSSAREESKSKDLAIAKCLVSLAAKDKVLNVKERQLLTLRKKRKLEAQTRRRHEKAVLAKTTCRCDMISILSPVFLSVVDRAILGHVPLVLKEKKSFSASCPSMNPRTRSSKTPWPISMRT